MVERWEQLRKDIQERAFGNVAAYAQYLRAEGRVYALATARSTTGSFSASYNYLIEIKDARMFYWAKNRTLGDPAPFSDERSVDKDYIVLNADTIADSTILGFGHNTGTREVTFFHDMPIEFVVSCNEIPVGQIKRSKKEDLSFEDKIKFAKLLR
jgi:hypothetical protein